MNHAIPLPDVATLYVAAAIHPDGSMSETERRHVIDVLSDRFTDQDPQLVGEVVLGAMASFPSDHEDQVRVIRHVAEVLGESLRMDEKALVIGDLEDVSASDGIILAEERTFVDALAELWGVHSKAVHERRAEDDSGAGVWSAPHDLALVYLGLAHGADDELSRSEVHAMRGILRRWMPALSDEAILDVLREAMERYAEGPRAELVEDAVINLRNELTAEQRRDALADLVRLANADGVFLDVEEDLIIRLQREWDIDPDALYD